MPIGPSEGFAASAPGPTMKSFEAGRDAVESDLPSRREFADRRSIGGIYSIGG
jgi:hypothetical protein